LLDFYFRKCAETGLLYLLALLASLPSGLNKYAFRAFCRRDWLQQYANAKSLQKFAKVFAIFCKLLQNFGAFTLFYLHVREALVIHLNLALDSFKYGSACAS